MTTPTIITEKELEAFRRERLQPAALRALIEKHVQLLVRVPVGVGKTHAAVQLLLDPETYRRFGLVVYAAPTWEILHEVISKLEAAGMTGWKVLRPRPSKFCGDLDGAWRDLEQRGCSTFAKTALCRKRCGHYHTCDWPKQMTELKGTRLVLMTEQRIGLIRRIVPLLATRARARRPLVLLDEARVLDGVFEVTIARDDLRAFSEVLARTRPRKEGWKPIQKHWTREIERLLGMDAAGLARGSLHFPEELHEFAYHVQRAGIKSMGPRFRYVGYDLCLLATSRPEERWLDDDGSVRFIARPYLDCHLALLSAHLTADYAGHRLGRDPLPSPFADLRFLHSGTHVVNLVNSAGANCHFKSNLSRVLDTFAVLLARNVAEGRTTLLVSRKKSKDDCAGYLQERLRGWGLDVTFVTTNYDELPPVPRPDVVPIIHYGILGVNDFSDYEAAYCLNSYYLNQRELNRAVQEFEPRHFRVELVVQRGPDRIRRVRLADAAAPDLDRTWLGSVYHRKLEVDPVIQALGRVRFLTRAREIVVFQMNDVEREVGRCETVRSFAELRAAFGVPSARNLDDALVGRQAARLMEEGLTGEEAGAALGVSRATVFRRLGAWEGLRFPLRDLLRNSETPTPSQSMSGGVA